MNFKNASTQAGNVGEETPRESHRRKTFQPHDVKGAGRLVALFCVRGIY